MGEDRGHVDAAARDEIEVDLHRVATTPLDLLDPEGIRADDRDLLEVERRPLEASRCLHARHHDRTPWGDDAEPDFDRRREPDGVVHYVHAAAVQPGGAVPWPHE